MFITFSTYIGNLLNVSIFVGKQNVIRFFVIFFIVVYRVWVRIGQGRGGGSLNYGPISESWFREEVPESSWCLRILVS